MLLRSLDREAEPSHEVTVIARSGSYPFPASRAKVTIEVEDVQDNIPEFDQSEYIVSLPESSDVGKTVITLQASSRDSFPLIYSIIGGQGEHFFSIDSTTGTVILNRPLQYIMRTTHRVIVQARNGPLLSETTLIVNVEDVSLSPVFSKTEYQFSVSPTYNASVFGYVFASDGDTPCGLPMQAAGLVYTINDNAVSYWSFCLKNG